MPQVLVVEDDRAIRRTLESFLQDEGCEVETATGGREALDRLRVRSFDLCLLDMGLPDLDGMSVLRQLRAEPTGENATPIIVVSGRDDMQSTVEAVKLGAYDYLLKPVDIDRLRLTVTRTLEQRRTSQTLAHLLEQTREQTADRMVGRSEGIREVFKAIGSVAPTRASVLVRGESGTGKELVARAVHIASGDGTEPFVAVNCTAFPRELLESELFGHVKGAFAGAHTDKIGRFAIAGNGTLFLDEIGEMPLDMQAKLLRVLQERAFERLGESRPQRLAARVIAATHRDLDGMVANGTFREDLSSRLRVVEIKVPALRDRLDDLPALVAHLLAKISRDLHTPAKTMNAEALDKLLAYSWPGNVRELENALTRACVLGKAEVLGAEHFPFLVEPGAAGGSSTVETIDWSCPPTLREVERAHVTRVLLHAGWNKRRACSLLAITRPTLDRKIKEYGLVRPPK